MPSLQHEVLNIIRDSGDIAPFKENRHAAQHTVDGLYQIVRFSSYLGGLWGWVIWDSLDPPDTRVDVSIIRMYYRKALSLFRN